MAKKSKSTPGVLNWMLTLILMAIPVVNLISAVLFAIFGKSVTKRKFAAAVIILMVLGALALFAVFVFLPDAVNSLIDWLRQPQSIG